MHSVGNFFSQFWILTIFLLSGFILGLMYDVNKICKKNISIEKTKNNKRKEKSNIFSICDAIFLLLSFVMISILIFFIDSGQLRWYQFLFSVVGFFIYKKLLSNICIKMILIILSIIITFLIKPICIVTKAISTLFKSVINFIKKIIKKLKAKTKKKK